MPWIQNVALSDVAKGRHKHSDNTILIQIVDPAMDFPSPVLQFKEVHQFEFLDLEKHDIKGEEFKISPDQASELVQILQKALDNNTNVVVHCVAGICRSGAVAEVGIMMGFEDTNAYRSPNLLVKHLMMKTLGWTYDENEQPTINGAPISEGLIVFPTMDNYK